MVEDIQPEATSDSSDVSNTDDETPVWTADGIISASGALTGVCEVTVAVREIDDREEGRIREFARQGCSCDYSLNKSPCCLLFSVGYYQSIRHLV